jgi:hypothetical protein
MKELNKTSPGFCYDLQIAGWQEGYGPAADYKAGK